MPFTLAFTVYLLMMVMGLLPLEWPIQCQQWLLQAVLLLQVWQVLQMEVSLPGAFRHSSLLSPS